MKPQVEALGLQFFWFNPSSARPRHLLDNLLMT
jgi:hypothetical protein